MSTDLAMVREKLFTSVLSDCLDACGVMNQALPSRIRPLLKKSSSRWFSLASSCPTPASVIELSFTWLP